MGIDWQRSIYKTVQGTERSDGYNKDIFTHLYAPSQLSGTQKPQNNKNSESLWKEYILNKDPTCAQSEEMWHRNKSIKTVLAAFAW